MYAMLINSCLAIIARHEWDVDGIDRSQLPCLRHSVGLITSFEKYTICYETCITSAGSFSTGMYKLSINLVITSKFQVLVKGDMKQVTH
jgi:hypothetical protein